MHGAAMPRGVCTIDCDVTGEFTRVYQAVHETNYRSGIQFCLTGRHLQFRNATNCRVMAQLQAKCENTSHCLFPLQYNTRFHSLKCILMKQF